MGTSELQRSPGTYVALLRGVNVSGQRRMGMAELRRSLEDLGLRRVRTYLQSGNVVFDASERVAPGRSASDLAAAIRARIAADFGHDVQTLVVPDWELREIAAANPFVAEPGVDERWLHVTFLFAPAAGQAPLPNLPGAAGERAVVTGSIVYLYLPYGYGRTKLTNAFFERALGTSATTRNWRTVLALAEAAASP